MGKKSISIMFAHFGHACNVWPFGWHASQRPHDSVLKWHGKSFWDLSHSCLELKLIRYGWGAMPWAQAYKVWVGRFSCRCGTSLKKTFHVTWGQSRADVTKYATQRVGRCKHAQSGQTWLRWISSPQTIFTFIYLTFEWWSIA